MSRDDHSQRIWALGGQVHLVALQSHPEHRQDHPVAHTPGRNAIRECNQKRLLLAAVQSPEERPGAVAGEEPDRAGGVRGHVAQAAGAARRSQDAPSHDQAVERVPQEVRQIRAGDQSTGQLRAAGRTGAFLAEKHGQRGRDEGSVHGHEGKDTEGRRFVAVQQRVGVCGGSLQRSGSSSRHPGQTGRQHVTRAHCQGSCATQEKERRRR